MEQITKKGQIKREIAKIDIDGCSEINLIIINTLLDNGYELVTKPTFNNMQNLIKEQITVYKVEQR